ncbi:FUSC family protein [Paraliobacillus zengyii]|uniref:FUSC family protein n=1 Tax=Paraliobacillus zengyii TaxID=2213194 RepID=UPI000E3CE72A|nr:FUSC family protein [Paraliobacillus zengyii]
MKHLHIQHAWVGRLIASDPGRKRLQQAFKATTSLMIAIMTMLLILRVSNSTLFTPVIVAGMLGMIGIMVVMDDTKKKKQFTTLLLAVSASVSITIGTYLADNPYYVGIAMVCIIFGAFYFSKFGSRYFSLGMVSFMTIYISSVLQLTPNQFGWFYVAICVGVMSAFLANFIIFKDSAHVLRRSMRSYHIQANLTLSILINLMEDPINSKRRINSLEKNVRKLSEYAQNVSGDLKEQDVASIWPGLKATHLRLYVFDTAMLIETLTDSIKQLKKAEGLEMEEVKRMLVWVVKTIRDAEVLAQNYTTEHLKEAENAVQGLSLILKDLQMETEEKETRKWLYLIRRIESIANHVVTSAATIQESLRYEQLVINEGKIDTEIDSKLTAATDLKEDGLKPTTKKAYQAMVASILALLVGHWISPIQPYWVILTVFLVLLGTESVGRTYIKGLQRSLGTICGAIIGFLLAQLVSGHTQIEVALLFIVVFFTFYFLTVSYTLMSLFMTILIAFMYDIILGGISYQLLGIRVIDTICGAIIALGVSTFIFPTKTVDKVAQSFVDYLTILNPFLIDYVRGFREDVNVKGLSGNAFDMDLNLQVIKNAAQSLLQRPGSMVDKKIPRWITLFTAINYYAKHLVASSYQNEFYFPEEIKADFREMEEKLQHNMELLSELISGNQHQGVVYHLTEQRERIERLTLSEEKNKNDLTHHLYYVWKINEAIVLLDVGLGAQEAFTSEMLPFK